MERIIVNQSHTATFRIPDSVSGNTVTYSIYKASDGATFASGSASFVAGENWKVTFTPTGDGETYILEWSNTTLDVKGAISFLAQANPVVTQAPVSGTTAQDLLTALNAAILARMNGGAVQSYMIGNRNIMYMPLGELIKFRDKLQAEVNLEESGGTVNYAGFVRPT